MAAEKLFTLLTAIARRGGAAGAAELAEALDMPRTSLYRVAGQLERLGYLQRVPGDRRFVLSPGALEMATEILGAGLRTAPRHAALVALSKETGESCSLGVQVGYEIVYLDDVTGTNPLTFHFQAGRRAPLYCTSIGKLYLAAMAPADLERFLRTAPLTRHTEWTVTDPEALRAIAAGTAAAGFATSNQEFVLGVVGAAVPVRAPSGRMLAGLAVSAPAARMAHDDLESLLPRLRRTAETLSRTLG